MLMPATNTPHPEVLCETKPRRTQGGHAASRHPELLGSEARSLGEAGKLGPDDLRIDGRLADPGAVTAIAAGDDVLASDQRGVVADALRDQLGVLDEVGLRFD